LSIFFHNILKVPCITKEILNLRTKQYNDWVESSAGNHKNPLEWTQKGDRKGCCTRCGTTVSASFYRPGVRLWVFNGLNKISSTYEVEKKFRERFREPLEGNFRFYQCSMLIVEELEKMAGNGVFSFHGD
jgi:hypothetical protein